MAPNNRADGFTISFPTSTETNLHDLGRYGSATAIGLGNVNKQQAIVQMIATPLPFLNCPSRRRDILFTTQNVPIYNAGGVNQSANQKLARTDYAINCGSAANNQNGAGPGTGADTLPLPVVVNSNTAPAQNTYFVTSRNYNSIAQTQAVNFQNVYRH